MVTSVPEPTLNLVEAIRTYMPKVITIQGGYKTFPIVNFVV